MLNPKHDNTIEFNSCASLVNPEIYKEAMDKYYEYLNSGVNPMSVMLDLQLSLQKELAKKLPKFNKDPSELETMGEIIDHLQRQNDALADENRELYLSLGEMSRGAKEASAIFKPWKARHEEARARKWEDISKEDKLEILFERIDKFHFEMNEFIGLKMTAEDIFVLYYIKQLENMRRYSNGY